MKKNVWVLGALWLLACSPGLTNPPSAPLENLSLWMQAGLSPSTESGQSGQDQAGLYLAARRLSETGSQSRACQNYQKLSVASTFPLRLLAELRALEVCGWDKATIEAWWRNREEDYSDFLRREFFGDFPESGRKFKEQRFCGPFSGGPRRF